MSSAFSIALSALQAQSEAIDTTGNNLANMNTVGYKGSTVDFETLISQNMGQGAGFEVGMGVGTPVNEQLFVQGPIQNSSSPTAVAMQGNGFFVVNNSGGQQLFTRDGDFTIDQNGTLVTQTGEKVQGWTTVDSSGNIVTTSASTNVVLPSGQVLPAANTTTFSMTANLDSSTAAGSTWTQTIPVIDSLGNTHNLTITLTNVSNQQINAGLPGVNYPANTWTYQVSMPNSDLTGNGVTGTSTNLLPVAGTISFNSSGTMVTTTPAPTTYSIATTSYTAITNTDKDQLTFTANDGTTKTVTLNSTTGDNVTDALAAIQAQLTGTGISATASGSGISFTSANPFSISDQQTTSGGKAIGAFPTLNSTSYTYNTQPPQTAGGTATTFPASVTLALPSGTSLADSANFGDSANHTITWNLLDSNGNGTLTQYAEASGVQTKTIDGSAPAQLTNFSIQNGGLIVATFSNGQQKTEGQLAVASIQNPDSLQSVGDNNYQASGATSTPAIGLPQTGGRGQILGGSLEGSTVDMATEFTKLITYQSGYQASSRVITVADDMTQDLMNLIH
jgi:flagellar hook protein FlgE